MINRFINNEFYAKIAKRVPKYELSIGNFVLILSAVVYSVSVASVATIYEGSVIRYVLFSVTALLMLLTGIGCRLGYGAAILSIFLWLGLWLKLSVNLFLSRSFTEATGQFEFQSHQYDEFMIVATLVCLGVSGAWMISMRWIIEKQCATENPSLQNPSIDLIGPILQKYLWGILIFLIILINIANIQFGFVQSGLVARRIFPWPTNAVACWLLYSGLAFFVASLLHMDLINNKNISAGILISLFEASVGGITTISRGLYLWHVLPIFMVAWVNLHKFRSTLSARALVLYTVLALVGFFVVGTAVNVFRSSLYDSSVDSFNFEIIYNTQSNSVVASSARMVNLIVDRWIGAEGIMVAVGHPNKSMELFKDLLAEKPAIGYVNKYQFIAKSHYSQMDPNKYQFNTLPGVGGFLYLSGSFLVVFAGTMLLALFVLASERLIYLISGNSFFCALSGVCLANMVAQIGLTPRQLLPQIAMNFAVIIFFSLAKVYLLRRGWLAR